MDKPTSSLTGRQKFFWKSVKWYIANMIIGVFPLIVLWLVCTMCNNKVGIEPFNTLLYHDAIILFVSTTLMGATIIDFHLGGFETKGNILLCMYGVPALAFGLLLLQYILNRLKLSEGELFDLKSPLIIYILAISCVYCIIGKFYVYLREEIKERKDLGINV